MRWITEARTSIEDWDTIGGPYKTLPLAKRCARQRLAAAQEEKQETPRFRIRAYDGGPIEAAPVTLESAGLQGGWRIIWEPTADAQRQLLARRLMPVLMQTLRDLAAHQGDGDPFAQATGLKWGLWSVEAAAAQVLADPELTPEALHRRWVASMEEKGWQAGPVVDLQEKTHPSLVAHQYLSADEQTCDVVFVSTVRRTAELLEAAA
jgi:hypothetical protein